MGHEFLGEKTVIPSTQVPGIDNDQSLNVLQHIFQLQTQHQNCGFYYFEAILWHTAALS